MLLKKDPHLLDANMWNEIKLLLLHTSPDKSKFNYNFRNKSNTVDSNCLSNTMSRSKSRSLGNVTGNNKTTPEDIFLELPNATYPPYENSVLYAYLKGYGGLPFFRILKEKILQTNQSMSTGERSSKSFDIFPVF